MAGGCNHHHLLHIRMFCSRPQHGVGTQGPALGLLRIRPLQVCSRIKDLRFKGAGCQTKGTNGALTEVSHSLKSDIKGSAVGVLLRAVREGSSPSLSPSSWQSSVLLGLRQDNSNLHLAFSLCLCVQISPKDIVILNEGSTLPQYDLIFINYLFNDLFTNKVTFNSSGD